MTLPDKSLRGTFSKKNKLHALFEVLFLLIALSFAFHFIQERIQHQILPGGDEGSWLSAAAQWSKGQGFSTNWLEYHYLEPYTLPRPDDFRYPALVSLIGIGFLFFGIKYSVALYVVASIFFTFSLLFYFTIRKTYNRTTAALSLLLLIFSLLQLTWNSVVYTEGLFGIVLCLIILGVKKDLTQLKWGFSMGALFALLYLVRPNGVLFLPAFCLSSYFALKQKTLSFKSVSVILLTSVVCLAPWLIRSWIYFGNPFHIAGSAGLLKDTVQETDTLTLLSFFENNGLFFPLKRVVLGSYNFFINLHYYEHGLEALPLLGVVIGIWKRKKFHTLFITLAFAITLLMCFYSSYNAWAGVRYFSGFIPFVYAYGIHQLLSLLKKFRPLSPSIRWGAITLLLVVLLSPVFYPHRFYERKYSQAPILKQEAVSDYIQTLQSTLPPSNIYLAMSLGQLNFMANRKCIGIQGSEYKVALSKALSLLKPTLLVLTPNEYKSKMGGDILKFIERKGYLLSNPIVTSLGVFISLSKQVTLTSSHKTIAFYYEKNL